jgi:hypothetical protein
MNLYDDDLCFFLSLIGCKILPAVSFGLKPGGAASGTGPLLVGASVQDCPGIDDSRRRHLRHLPLPRVAGGGAASA